MKIKVKGTIDQKRSKKKRMAAEYAATKKEYKQLKKEQKQSKKKVALNHFTKLSLTIILIAIACVLIFTSGAFNVSEIIVEKNSKLSSDQVISFSGIQVGINLFSISKQDVTNKLKENSYIESVEIKRCLPDKIKLIVDERKVEYIVQLASSYVYIDKNGYVLEISNEKPNVPIVIGFTTDLSNIKENSRLNDDDLEKMKTIRIIMNTAEKNDLNTLISKIDISNPENYSIYLDSESKIAHLGNGTELNTRFLYIKAILKEQKEKKGEIFADVDLNTEYVYFRENT